MNKEGKPFNRKGSTAMRRKPKSSAVRVERYTPRGVPKMGTERLLWAAIIREEGVIEAGHRTHAYIRQTLGDDDPYTSMPGDIEGFVTDTGRFVTREQAKAVGVASGQLSPDWATVQRSLLSSDINWDR